MSEPSDNSGLEYWFYHLEASTLEDVLPGLLEKVQQRGWTALVKLGGAAEDRLAELDQYLWTFRDNSFLPHGRDDEPLADVQPVLLSATAATAGGKDCVLLVDGAEVDDMSGVTRAIVMINGRNSEDVKRERGRWKKLSDAGASLAYFQQDERGGWVKKA